MTRFVFTEEQAELRSVLRRLFDERSSYSQVREIAESQNVCDEALWHRLGEEVGVLGLTIPVELGGSGCGDVELGILLEEAGRALVCTPIFGTVVLATTVLLASDNDKLKAKYLPGIANGEVKAAVARADVARDMADVVHAKEVVGGWVLEGSKQFVIDGHIADLLVVSAHTPDGVSLFTVEVSNPGVTVALQQTLDLTRRQSVVTFVAATAELLVPTEKAPAVLDEMDNAAAVALAVEQVGAAARCLEMAVEYAKLREQFGQPIGSFQAIKHRCADMLIELELARSVAYNAMWARSEAAGDEDVVLATSMAKSLCSEAFVFIATENIQIHGGIGFTWEHPAHLYFRRARSSAVMFGDAAWHRERIAERLGV